MPDGYGTKAWNMARAGLGAAITPLVDPETARMGANVIEGVEAAPTEAGFFDLMADLPGAAMDIGRNLYEQPGATLRGAAGGATEGLASLTDPLTLATLPFGGEGRGVSAGLRAGERAAVGAGRGARALPGLAEGMEDVSRMMPKKPGAGGSSALDELGDMFKMYGDDAASEAATVKPRLQANASGDSSASIEAINRLKGEAAAGKQRVRLDRAGRETPLIGTDAVDQSARAGETIAFRLPDGTYQVIEQGAGARLPPHIRTSLPKK